MASYQTCIDHIKDIRANWYSKNQAGAPIEGDLIAKRSLCKDIDYDYFPTDIDSIDQLLESFREWVVLCQDEEKYGDISELWLYSGFTRCIVYATLMLEGRQGICINDKIEQERYVNRLISGNIDSIDLLVEEEPFGLWGELTRMVYICWLPIAARYKFDEKLYEELEILILRIALQASNFIGKNGITRAERVNSTRGIARVGGAGEKDHSKIIKIKETYKNYMSQGVEPRSKRVSKTASDCKVTTTHVNRVLRNNHIDLMK